MLASMWRNDSPDRRCMPRENARADRRMRPAGHRMDPADGAGLHDGGAECAVATPGERLALVHGLEPWCDDMAEAMVPDPIATVSAVSASADDPKVPEIGERRKRSESGEIGERGERGERGECGESWESGGSSENGERGESGEFWDDEDGEMYENDEYDEKSGTRGLGSGSRPMLAMLSGVEPHDADTSVRAAPQNGAAARWVISQRACMAIILVLVVALAASLALVVRQGSTILQVAEGSVAAAPGTQSGTQPGARSGAGAGSAQSSESHTMAESDGAGESSASPAPGAASSDTTAPGSAAPSDTSGTAGAASPGAVGKVNLNTATSEELQTIKGVGPATAQKILDYRAAHGRFTSVDELLKIDGIGAKTLEKIRPEVTI